MHAVSDQNSFIGPGYDDQFDLVLEPFRVETDDWGSVPLNYSSAQIMVRSSDQVDLMFEVGAVDGINLTALGGAQGLDV